MRWAKRLGVGDVGLDTARRSQSRHLAPSSRWACRGCDVPRAFAAAGRRLGALADRFTLLLSHQSRAIPTVSSLFACGMSTAARLHAGFLQAQQEVRIAAQSVELGDHELRVVGAAG